jgi:hypothetical protein
MGLPSFRSIGSDWDLCGVDSAVNHPVNGVKQLSCDTPLSTSHVRSFLRARKSEDEAFSRKDIFLVFRDRSNAGVCVPGPPKSGGGDPCRQARAIGPC